MALLTTRCASAVSPRDAMSGKDPNSIGARGENIVELRLTEMSSRRYPLFRPTHLGDKFPVLDYYVEVTGPLKYRPFFLLQVKATSKSSSRFQVNPKKLKSLLEYGVPTYLALVDEPRRHVYLASVHTETIRSTYRKQPRFRLTTATLKILRAEVIDYWRARMQKPIKSYFHGMGKS